MTEKEYIDKELLIKAAKKYGIALPSIMMNSVPAADVRENVKGEWITEYEPNGKPYCFHCSACDDDFRFIAITTAYDFCPNCGADMRGKNK